MCRSLVDNSLQTSFFLLDQPYIQPSTQSFHLLATRTILSIKISVWKMEKKYLYMYIVYNTVNWVKLCIYCMPSHEAVRIHIFYKVFPKQSYLVTGLLWFVTETKIWYVRNSWWSKKIKRTIAASISFVASAVTLKLKNNLR